MLQSYLTHTEKSQPGGAAPHFGDNDNLSVSQVSFFYGGKIAGKLGAFFQATYDGVGRRLAWDNLDIRYADTAKIGNVNATLGISVNNNPTVQDLWNTTPAWGTPFSGTDLAPSPAAAPLIAGGLAQQVIGVSAYAMWDGWLYTEIGGYRRLSNRLQTILGVSPAGENTVSGVAPYWRVTAQHDFGDHYLSLGTFGISSKLYPGQLESAGTDRTTDIGLDLSYEYIGDEDNFISAYSSFISEHQSLSASSVLGVTSNSSNYLRSVNTTVSYTYLQTYTGSLGYFDVWGSSDAALYSGSAIGSPDSRGFTAEVDYTPFGKADAPFGNRLNLRLGLQYTGYFKFDGSKDNYDGAGRNASDNNTLALMAWFMF